MTRRFRLAVRGFAPIAALGLSAVILGASSCGRDRRSAQPDVLLITIDTLRADRVGPRLTPALEWLGSQGVRFTRATGRPTEARPVLERAVKLDPHDAEARDLLARLGYRVH